MFFGNTMVSALYDNLCIGNNAAKPRNKPTCGFIILKDKFVMSQVIPFYGFSVKPPAVGTNGLQKTLPFFSCGSITNPTIVFSEDATRKLPQWRIHSKIQTSYDPYRFWSFLYPRQSESIFCF